MLPKLQKRIQGLVYSAGNRVLSMLPKLQKRIQGLVYSAGNRV